MEMYEGGREENNQRDDSDSDSDSESGNAESDDDKHDEEAGKTVEDGESLGAIAEEHTERRERTSQRRKKQYAVSTRWEREVSEEKHDGSPVVVAGPCWPFCVGITVPLIVGISATVIFLLILNPAAGLPIWVAGIYVPILLFTMGALFCVSCRDPGLMERVTDEEAGEGGWYWNEQVGSYRPPGALYCRECGVLVQDYDHLCPWTGTGIGHKNMMSFKVFVVAVNVLCYSSIILVAVVLLQGLVRY